MKLKILIIAIITTVAVACSSEDSVEIVPQDSLEIVESDGLNGRGPGEECRCDAEYVFPELLDPTGFSQINVVFSSDLREDEIHCMVYEYFECEYKTRVYMEIGQPWAYPYSQKLAGQKR